MKTRLTLFLIALISALTVIADNGKDGYFFSKVDYQQGLSNSSVLCLFQDNVGLMWFGTYDGLNCYDGKTMEVFRSDLYKKNTLSNNIVYSIQQADSNSLWIATHFGIDRFFPGAKKVVRHYEYPVGYEILSNSKGNTWLLAQDEVYYYNIRYKNFIKVDVPQMIINDLKKRSFVDDKGSLWMLPENGTQAYSFSVSSYAQERKDDVRTNTFSLHSKPIKRTFYQNGILCFVDYDSDLYIYDVQRESKIYIRNVALLEEKYGAMNHIIPFFDDIIIVFPTNGIFKLKASQKYAESLIEQTGRLFCSYKDKRQGIIWFGGDGNGVFKYAQQNIIANNILLKSLSSQIQTPVRGILTDKQGGLWIGTKGDGLIRLPNYLHQTSWHTDGYVYSVSGKQRLDDYAIRWNPELQVITMKESRYMDGFWIGTSDNALYYYLYKSDRLQALKPSGDYNLSYIHSIYEDNDSVLWVTTSGNGFYKVTLDKTGEEVPVIKELRNYTFVYEDQALKDFYALLPESDSLLWIGSTQKGLVRFNKYTEKYQIISLSNLLHKSVDAVLSLHRHSGGQLYVGTTAGLVELSMGEDITAKYIGRKHGLLNEMIHSIVEDENGFLFLGTNRGLVKYNPDSNTSHVYYYTAGVEVGEFSDDSYYTCPYSGNLFLGGVNGLIYINKDITNIPEYYSDILLRKLIIGQDEVNLEDYYDRERNRLVFHGGDCSFSLGFIAPDYLTGEYIEYSHCLEGYDSEWSLLSNQNELFYAHIPAGEYTLKIRYRKDVFDTEYRYYEVGVSVLPPWYATWWAYIFYVLLFLSCGYYLYRLIHELYKRRMDENGKDGYIDKILLAEWNDRTNAIYQACERIAEDSISYEERCGQVNVIREQILGLARRREADAGVPQVSVIESGIGWKQLLEKLPVRELPDWTLRINCTTHEQDDLLRNVILLIDANIDREDLGSTFLAGQLAISPRQLYRRFKEFSEMSPGDLIKDYRMGKAAYLLANSQLSISEVVSDVGIISRSHFYKEFTSRYGMTPKEYREKYTV